MQYALRRWYCFWGARLAELLFLGHAGVRPGPPKHHEIDFTIDQQPYLQGFLPVQYLYLSKLSGGVVIPSETNTGLVFLDSTSAKLFLDTKSRFEGDAAEQKLIEPAG